MKKIYRDVIVALDFNSKNRTLEFLDLFKDEKLYVKVGMELFYKEGAEIVREIKKRGHKIFLDLKLHDIPNTVKKATESIMALDCDMINFHIAGGYKMLKDATDIAKETNPDIITLGITILTSITEEIMHDEINIDKSLDLENIVSSYANIGKNAGLGGDVIVDGLNTKNDSEIWNIRSRAGMVFQNPDNQLVATVVEDDVAFGPENLGVEPSEIRRRVDYALNAVNMLEYKKNAPHLLSGGQKQRIAISGILAMSPTYILLDEPTAMLDPSGRKEVMDTIIKLNREESKTIVLITHYMDEAALADRIIVMEEGEVVLEGTPREVFSKVEEIKKLGLDVPQVTELAYELKKDGFNISNEILSIEELVKEICP